MEADSPSSVRALAKAINVAPRIVQEMVDNGEITKGPDGRFDVSVALKVKEERARRQRGGFVYDPELQELKIKRETNRFHLEALTLAEKAHQVVRKEKVIREWSYVVLEMKQRMAGLGREVAPLVIGRSPQEVQAIIDGRVFEIMRALHKLTVKEPANDKEGA